MDYKAKITHVYRTKFGNKRMYAYIDKRSFDTPPDMHEPPFYYPVGTVTTPSISVSNNTVTITASGADVIYYTKDGSAPDKSKTKYTGAFAISATVTVKAIAYDDDVASAVASKECVYVAPPDDEDSETSSEVIG